MVAAEKLLTQNCSKPNRWYGLELVKTLYEKKTMTDHN
jgi:hypothetical protein